MTQIDRQSSNSQKYISSKTSYNGNQVVYIVNAGTPIREISIPKNIQFFYFTSSDVDSSYKFSTTPGSNYASNSSSSIQYSLLLTLFSLLLTPLLQILFRYISIF